MKLLVTGGRDFADREFVWSRLDRANAKRAVLLLIHGDATGADTLAREWAEARDVCHAPVPVSPADWRRLGPRAGPLRNQSMIDLFAPDGCIAFPGGTGTADCVARVCAANIPLWAPPYPPLPGNP